MRLSGGIQEGDVNKRYRTNTPPTGREVIFLNEHGTRSDLDNARRYLRPGEVLVVKEIHIHPHISEVEFLEAPGILFNTVMFKDI